MINLQSLRSGGTSGADLCNFLVTYRDVDPKPLEDLRVKLYTDIKVKRNSTQKLSEDNDFEIIDFTESPPKYSETRKVVRGRSSSLSSPIAEDPSRSSTKRNIIGFELLKTKPGKIFNHHLMYFDNNSNMKLKDDLTENQDYFLVDSNTWTFLNKWYGWDIEAKYVEPYDSEDDSEDNFQESEENEGESDENEAETEENEPDSDEDRSSGGDNSDGQQYSDSQSRSASSNTS